MLYKEVKVPVTLLASSLTNSVNFDELLNLPEPLSRSSKKEKIPPFLIISALWWTSNVMVTQKHSIKL